MIVRKVALLILIISWCSCTHSQVTLFLSTEGNDAWSGQLSEPNAAKTDGPFSTIERARNAIRELKENNNLSDPVTVNIRGGTYFLDRTIVFRPVDSGTKESPITYIAYPGEKPVFSGGRKIEAFWETYKDDVLVCSIPEVRGRQWYFRQLFVNGKRQTRARIPHDGYLFIEEAVADTSFRFRKGDFKNWHNLKDIEIVMFHSWNESRLIVSELDEDERILKCLDSEAPHPIGWTSAGSRNRYYIDNVFEGLQFPGDWYLDAHTGKLYYWPCDDMENQVIIAPVLNQLVRFEDQVQYINIRGLTFSDTEWTLPAKGYPDCGDVGDMVYPSAITFENARQCIFEDNIIRNVGTYALELTGSGNKIVGNNIFSTGSGGIISRNYDKEPNVISYNQIHHCGEVYHSAVAINIDDGGGNIGHNLIHDISHSGIYARHWAMEHQPRERENQEQALIIEYNEIHDVMQKMNDGAGIFIRDSNIIIRNNLIHDVLSFDGACPGWGIYLGCETRNNLVENNVIYRTRESMHVFYKSRNIVIENNIFVDGGQGTWTKRKLSQIDYSNPPNLSFRNIRFLRNIIYYSNMRSNIFFIEGGERSIPMESDYNVIFCNSICVLKNPVIEGLPGVDSFQDWQDHGFDKNSIVADPMFTDPENDDFSLNPGSPAFRLGFISIDLSKVGPGYRNAK